MGTWKWVYSRFSGYKLGLYQIYLINYIYTSSNAIYSVGGCVCVCKHEVWIYISYHGLRKVNLKSNAANVFLFISPYILYFCCMSAMLYYVICTYSQLLRLHCMIYLGILFNISKCPFFLVWCFLSKIVTTAFHFAVVNTAGYKTV